jgi:diaminopimelate decarboxylase
VKANSSLAIWRGLPSSARFVSSAGDRVVKAGAIRARSSSAASVRRQTASALGGRRVLNVEARAARRVSIVARRGVRAPIALGEPGRRRRRTRIPTGLRENKFGVSVEEARRLYPLAAATTRST